MKQTIQLKKYARDFPGGPVVRTQRFHCHGRGTIPGWGTKIPQATLCGQKEKKRKRDVLKLEKINV